MMIHFDKNGFIEIKNELTKDLNSSERKIIKNENIKIIENGKNKRKNTIIGNNNKISYYTITIIIKYLIILDIFSKKIKNIIFNSFYFQISKITLKINGTGYNNIFGSRVLKPNEIYINGNKQEKVNNNYFFNQTDNFV